jgi:hypothetical protein
MSNNIKITITGADELHQIALAHRIQQMLEYLDVASVVEIASEHTTLDNWKTELASLTDTIRISNGSSSVKSPQDMFLEHLAKCSSEVENWPSWKKNLWPEQQPKPQPIPDVATERAQNIIDQLKKRTRKQ